MGLQPGSEIAILFGKGDAVVQRLPPPHHEHTGAHAPERGQDQKADDDPGGDDLIADDLRVGAIEDLPGGARHRFGEHVAIAARRGRDSEARRGAENGRRNRREFARAHVGRDAAPIRQGLQQHEVLPGFERTAGGQGLGQPFRRADGQRKGCYRSLCRRGRGRLVGQNRHDHVVNQFVARFSQDADVGCATSDHLPCPLPSRIVELWPVRRRQERPPVAVEHIGGCNLIAAADEIVENPLEVGDEIGIGGRARAFGCRRRGEHPDHRVGTKRCGGVEPARQPCLGKIRAGLGDHLGAMPGRALDGVGALADDHLADTEPDDRENDEHADYGADAVAPGIARRKGAEQTGYHGAISWGCGTCSHSVVSLKE